jgi:hypothetical protein
MMERQQHQGQILQAEESRFQPEGRHQCWRGERWDRRGLGRKIGERFLMPRGHEEQWGIHRLQQSTGHEREERRRREG